MVCGSFFLSIPYKGCGADRDDISIECEADETQVNSRENCCRCVRGKEIGA